MQVTDGYIQPIANSSIWKSIYNTSKFELYQIVQLPISDPNPPNDNPTVIIEDLREIGIDVNLTSNFESNDKCKQNQHLCQMFHVSRNCNAAIFNCNNDALAPNEQLFASSPNPRQWGLLT